MHKTKLIQALSMLSVLNLQRFRDFVDSPYFNKHEKTKVLLAHLLKIKNWESPRLKKEKVFAKVFPNQKYEEQLLSNVTSYLFRLLRQFYVQKQSEKEPMQQQLQLLEISLHERQEKLFSLVSNKFEKQLNKQEKQDSSHFFQQHKYAQLLDEFDLRYGNRSDSTQLEKALSHFDTFFIAEKLKMTCGMLARRQVTGRDYAFPLTQEILVYIKKERAHFEHIPSVWLYFLVYQMTTTDTSDAYFELKKRLKADTTIFSPEEGRDLYTHALNYSIGRLNRGETAFGREAFDLYQQMLDGGLLYQDGVLQQWDYTNFVSLGINIGESQRIEKFIVEQKNKLSEAVRENTYTYNLASFHYWQKAYATAIETLQKVAFTDVYFNLSTRILTLKIYYETQNEKALEYSLETFRIYLLRTKQISKSRQKSGLNLISLTRKMARLRSDKDFVTKTNFTKKKDDLAKKIEESKSVLQRAWLLEKVKLI